LGKKLFIFFSFTSKHNSLIRPKHQQNHWLFEEHWFTARVLQNNSRLQWKERGILQQVWI
jgi:hypothetical protein